MKKLLMVCVLAALVAGLYMNWDKFGGSSKAFEAYKKHAHAETWGSYTASRKVLMQHYGMTEFPNIMDIKYKLESDMADKCQQAIDLPCPFHMGYKANCNPKYKQGRDRYIDV